MKYNYVICLEDSDLYRYTYSDLNTNPNVIIKSSIKSLLKYRYPFYRLHLGPDTNKYFNIPFKNLWVSALFSDVHFDNDKPICFIFTGIWAKLCFETNLIEYLKKKFPKSKHVWFLQDLYKKIKPMYFSRTHELLLSLDKAERLFDKIISYDQGDCDKYGFIYHPTVYSEYKGEKPNAPKYDIYFCGKVKDRLNVILNVFEKLKSQNLNVYFYLTGVDPSQQKYAGEGIGYGNYLSYNDIIRHVLDAKCILEIIQEDSKGYTIRTNEAIFLNKKLLSNNKQLLSAPFYNSKAISVFDEKDLDTIDFNFLKDDGGSIDIVHKNDISTDHLLNFIGSIV